MPPLRTLGGVLKRSTALAPWKLPREGELRHDHEVSTILDVLKEFTLLEGREFGISFRGEEIGKIRKGELDRGLREGLMRSWAQHLSLSQDLDKSP